MDPWQRLVMTHALGRRANQWAAFEVDVTVGRQSGKGALLEARELAGIEIFGNKLVIHTAHELKTAEEARLRMENICEASPDLDRQVKRVVRTNGKEAIEFRNGARIKYAARSKGSGRGFTGDLLVMDEKMFLRSEPMAALLPTLATSADPQVWYMGSAFLPDSEHQVALRERMIAGNDPSLAAFEWSCEDDADLDDPRQWAIANPALGIRISEEFIRRERAALDDADFARERLGIGSGGSHAVVIDLDLWAELAEASTAPAPAAFALDVTPDRARASIAMAGLRGDVLRVELVENARGTGWVVARAAALYGRYKRPFLLDPSAPAGSLIPALRQAGVDIVEVSGREMSQACGAFYDLANDRRLRHFNQRELNVALAAARKRTLGDAWAWHRKDLTDISPLVAVTLAAWSASQPQESERSVYEERGLVVL